MLYCTILYYTILYYTLYAMLHYTIRHYTILYYLATGRWAGRGVRRGKTSRAPSSGESRLTLGNFASQNFGIFLRSFCKSFAENCGDLRRLSFFHNKMIQSIAENCGDEESAQKLRRKMSKSWLVKFPNMR